MVHQTHSGIGKCYTIVTCASLLITAACSGPTVSSPLHPPVRTGPPRQLTKHDLTPAEQQYGVAPVPDPSVIYQPDVIVVGGGAESIRRQSSNGLTWTIDADAPHAADLATGKIFFMTGRAVGRVLDVRRDGSNLAVTIGPVDLVEVVRKAHIEIHIPIDFSEALAYTAPDMPGQSVEVGALGKAMWSDDPNLPGSRAWRTDVLGGGLIRVADPKPSALKFKVVPVVSQSGLGVRATSQVPGLTLTAQAHVNLAAPRLDVVLDLSDGVKEASVELSGAAGLKLEFQAVTESAWKANVNEMFQPDTDFSIPVYGVGPVPLAVTVRQTFIVKTAFGVRNTTLSATGDYGFDGSFKIGWVNKQWGIFGPKNFVANKSLLQTTRGRSAAITGFAMTDQVKVIVGVGTQGFVAGPFFAVNNTIGISRNSDIGMLECREATLYVSLLGGVGYVIPKAVTNAINFLLRQLNIKYRLEGEGGFSSNPMVIVNSSNKAPHSDACRE